MQPPRSMHLASARQTIIFTFMRTQNLIFYPCNYLRFKARRRIFTFSLPVSSTAVLRAIVRAAWPLVTGWVGATRATTTRLAAFVRTARTHWSDYHVPVRVHANRCDDHSHVTCIVFSTLFQQRQDHTGTCFLRDVATQRIGKFSQK